MTSATSPQRAGHGADDDARDRELGLDLITRFQGLLRAARLYDESNRAYRRQIEEFQATVAGAPEEETVVVGMGDSFYVNGVRLRPTAAQVALFHALQTELASRGIGALRLRRGLGGAEIAAFLRLFLAAQDVAQGERLPELATAEGIVRIIPVRASELRAQGPGSEDEDSPEAQDERARAREIFQRAVEGTKSLLLRTVRTGKPPLRLARRLIQPVVDCVQRSEFSVVGLTALKNHDEYTFAHCVNVSVLAVAIGQRLGLPRAALANLGVAALLHDVGKTAVPADVLRKPGALSPEEWQSIQRHPLEGVKLVSHMPGLSTLMLDTMRVGFEHHLDVEGAGYPRLPAPRLPGAFTRVVSVADVFDALTAHRAYRWRPFTGYEALQHLMSPGRVVYDPAALWALVRSVGLYPAGTLLLTVSGHVVLSLSPNPADPRRPFCRLLEQPDGTRLDDPAATWDPMPPHEEVARVLTPEEWPGDVQTLLAA
jgi:HD-GYP domain-containing protein (c-di-GMP phosphodiesterase class II)